MKFLFNLLLFLRIFDLHAQKSELIKVSIIYNFIHVKSLNNKDKPLQRLMLLEVGNTNAKYCNYEMENQLKAVRNNNLITARPSGLKMATGYPLTIVNSAEKANEYYFQIPTENKLIRFEDLAMQMYQVDAPLHPIVWQITKETKSIQNYVCQKAIGSFAGRIYTAWFTTELPFNYGPWKLWGLPGLIVEAYDAKKEVQFLCKEIITNKNKDDVILFFAGRPIKITEEKLAKAKAKFYNDPIGISNATNADQSVREVALHYVDADGNTLTGEAAKAAIKKEMANLKYNNPIELIKP